MDEKTNALVRCARTSTRSVVAVDLALRALLSKKTFPSRQAS